MVDNSNKSLFVSFGSHILDNQTNSYSYVNNTIDIPNEKVEKILSKFTGLHFYFINKKMATYLLEQTFNMTYQLDIHLGICASYQNYYDTFQFLNVDTGSIKQDKSFISDVQLYNIKDDELFQITKNMSPFLPIELIHLIIWFSHLEIAGGSAPNL